jgi:hypothetical protein
MGRNRFGSDSGDSLHLADVYPNKEDGLRFGKSRPFRG